MGKRATHIFGTPAPKKEDARPEAPNGEADAPMTGNWSRMAFKAMESRLQERSEELNFMLESQVRLLVDGKLPIAIPADLIVDEIGSDRFISTDDSPEDPASFPSLVENIKRRGLRTPIRVRPINPDWRPDTKDPFNIEGQTFSLQSGRRRLAACIELGITPLAFLSFTEEAISKSADLQERFFENVARRELSMGEKLFSIGLMTENLPGLDQAQAADVLQVPRSHVSKGLKLYREYDRIKNEIDLSTATLRQIESALAHGAPQKSSEVKTSAADPSLTPFKNRRIGQSKLSLSSNKAGVHTLKITSRNIDDDLLEHISKLLENHQKRH